MEQLDILLPRHTLEEALGPELAKQARLRWGEECKFMPVSDGQRYRCSCGCVNPNGEVCSQCGRLPELLDRSVLEQLSREAELRQEEETKEAARQAALRKRKSRQKIRNICFWTVGAVAVLILAAVGFRHAAPAIHYSKAQKALAAAEYQLAHREFTLAGDYKDAPAYLERFVTRTLSYRRTSGGKVSEVVYTYDSQGRQLKEVEKEYTLDEKGKLLLLGEPVERVQSYDEKGNCLTAYDWSGHWEYTYNEQGDVISQKQYRQDGQHIKTESFTYSYDAQGRKTVVSALCTDHLSPNYSYEQTVRYTYDEKGNVVEWKETIEGVYEDTNNSVHKTTCRYDDNGRLMEERISLVYKSNPYQNWQEVTTNAYDKEGRQITSIKVRECPSDPFLGVISETRWEYDREGKVVREAFCVTYAGETLQRENGYTGEISYTYDLQGRLTKIKKVRQGAKETISEEEIYTYGADGILDTKVLYWENGNSKSSTVTTYDDNGLEKKVENQPAYLQAWVVEYTYAYFYCPDGA